MLIPLNKAKPAQLKKVCDDFGLDYSDIKKLDFTGMAQLRARITAAGVLADNMIEDGEAEAAPAAPAPAPETGEVLPPEVFDKIADAIFRTAARKVGDVYYPSELKIPADRNEAMRLAIAHRDATRADPRNPFPGKAHGDKVRLLIQQQDVNKAGDIPVFANYNEHASQIARGVWHVLDWETACVIANAKMDSIKALEGGGFEIVGQLQTFPYQAA